MGVYFKMCSSQRKTWRVSYNERQWVLAFRTVAAIHHPPASPVAGGCGGGTHASSSACWSQCGQERPFPSNTRVLTLDGFWSWRKSRHKGKLPFFHLPLAKVASKGFKKQEQHLLFLGGRHWKNAHKGVFRKHLPLPRGRPAQDRPEWTSSIHQSLIPRTETP